MNAESIDALFPPLVAKETRGRAWQYDGGQLKPINLRLGITDGNMTEVLDDAIQPGAELVTGMVLPGVTRASSAAGNPLLPGRGGPGGPGGGFGGPGGGGRGR